MTAAENFCVGGDNRSGNTQYFRGTIYEVALYEDVRTAKEIAQDAVLTVENEESLLYSEYFNDGAQIQKAKMAKLGGQSFASDVLCDLDELTAAPHTLEALIYVPRSMDNRAGVVVGNYGDSSGEQINLEVYTHGRIRLYIKNNGKLFDHIFNTDIRSDWPTHIAVTLRDTTATLYVNGVACESVKIGMTIPKATTGWRIGGDNRSGNTCFFQGEIYAVNLFGDARTAEEIKQDAKVVPATANDLLFTCYFEGDGIVDPVHRESDWIVDCEPSSLGSGIRHIECTVCGKILRVSEIVNDFTVAYGDLGAYFGAGSVPRPITQTFSSTPRTFEAILQLSPECEERGGVLIGNYTGGAEAQISLEIYSDGKPRLYYRSGEQSYGRLFKTDVRGEKMTHLAVTIDGLKATLYLNGVAKETATLEAELPNARTGYFIGGDNRSGNTQYFKGKIYSVGVFADVRTANEIAEDMILIMPGTDNLLYSEYLSNI